MGVVRQRHVQDALPTRTETRAHLQVAVWAPGPVWTGAENLSHIGIRSPDRPALSELLYRLRYPGPRRNGTRVTRSQASGVV